MENESADFMLSVGRCGCGNIIDNRIGVKGKNIVLDIDGIIHQMECDVKLPVANRFDGNNVIFEICYDDPVFISNTSMILMRHNYWGGQSLANYSYWLPYGNSSGFCPATGSGFSYPVDASQYVTNLNELKNCGEIGKDLPPKMAVDEFDDKTQRETACQTKSDGKEYSVRSQSKTAFRLLREESYNEALKEYIPVAALWSKDNGYSDQCNNMISVANCLTKALFSPNARLNGTGWNENAAAINDLLLESNYVVSPNPTYDFINVLSKNEAGDEQVYLIDLYGRIIQEMPLEKSMKFSVSDLRDGVYILKIMNSKGWIKHTEKVVVAKM